MATSLNRNLGRSSLLVVSYIPLFLTQTWQRAFVTSAVNDKKDNLSTTLTKSYTPPQIGEASGVGKTTVQRELSGVPNGTPETVKGKDGKEYPATKPKTQILDSYLRCYTQEEIAEKEGLSDSGAVAHILEGLLKNGNPAELQQSPMALHQVDFEIPIYNYALSSTSANLASSTAAGGNKRRGPSHYASHAAKSGNFEATTRCSQNLGGLSLRVSQLFPVSETPTENQKNKNKVCRNRRTF